MMEYKNWMLKEFSAVITPVFSEFKPYYAEYLISKGVSAFLDLSMTETFINWSKYTGYYSFWYYFEGCGNEVSTRLKVSEIMQYENLIMDFGKGNPVCSIPVSIFVDNWLDFVIGAQYLSTVATEDGKLLMEFIKGDILNSNFKI